MPPGLPLPALKVAVSFTCNPKQAAPPSHAPLVRSSGWTQRHPKNFAQSRRMPNAAGRQAKATPKSKRPGLRTKNYGGSDVEADVDYIAVFYYIVLPLHIILFAPQNGLLAAIIMMVGVIAGGRRSGIMSAALTASALIAE